MPCVGHLGLRNTRNLPYSPIFEPLFMQIFRQCFFQHANMCPTVQWSDWAFFNCLMVKQSCVQLSKDRIILRQTVQGLDSAVSNSPIQWLVKLFYGWPAECITDKWLDSAVPNSPSIRQCCAGQCSAVPYSVRV